MTITRYTLLSLFALLWLSSLRAQQEQTVPDHQLVISDVLIEGNKITKRNIILRELVFSVGDTIEKMEMIPGFLKSRENLLNLSIFNFVNLDAEHLPDNHINILISVTERWYIWPSPIFEHGERNLTTFLKEPQWSKLNYGLWLKWNNFRGRNEILNVKIRLGYKEQYVLQYEKPNLGASENHKIYLSYSLSRQHKLNYTTFENRPVYFQQEEGYAVNSADAFVAYSYRPGLYANHRIRLHYMDDWISDSIALLNPGYFGEGYTRYKHFKVDYVYQMDRRNSKVYPLEGTAYKLKLQRYGLGIISSYPYGNWEIEGTLFYHRKLTDRLYAANISKGKFSTNKEVPLFQQKALGYTENMIGYDSYVIDGTDYIVNKAIVKLQVVEPMTFTVPYIRMKQFNKVHFAMYLNIMGDVGYVNNQFPYPGNYMENALQYSAGIGLDFVTYYDKVLGVGYAINRYGVGGFFFYANTPFFEW